MNIIRAAREKGVRMERVEKKDPSSSRAEREKTFLLLLKHAHVTKGERRRTARDQWFDW
jgi:hypothetical protein